MGVETDESSGPIWHYKEDEPSDAGGSARVCGDMVSCMVSLASKVCSKFSNGLSLGFVQPNSQVVAYEA